MFRNENPAEPALANLTVQDSPPTNPQIWNTLGMQRILDEYTQTNNLNGCSGALGLRMDWFRNAEQQPDCDASGYVSVFFQKKLFRLEQDVTATAKYTIKVISGLELEIQVTSIDQSLDPKEQNDVMERWWQDNIEEPIQEQEQMLNAFQQMLTEEKHRRKPAIMGTYSERFADMAHMSVAPMIEGNFLPHVHFAQHWKFEPDMLMELLEMALEMTTYPR